jgi:hypothetical protein
MPVMSTPSGVFTIYAKKQKIKKKKKSLTPNQVDVEEIRRRG